MLNPVSKMGGVSHTNRDSSTGVGDTALATANWPQMYWCLENQAHNRADDHVQSKDRGNTFKLSYRDLFRLITPTL